MKMAYFNLHQNPIHIKYRDYSIGDYDGFYHYHQGIELLIVHQGKGHVVINSKLQPLESGTALCIQPYQLHRVHFEVSEHSPYERTVVTFEPTALVPFVNMFPAAHRFFERLWRGGMSSQSVRMGDSEPYINAMLAHYHNSLSLGRGKELFENASLMVVQLLDVLGMLLSSQSGPAAAVRSARHSETIMHYLEQRYAEPFDLGKLAEELHLSRHHISHLFREETGSSISDYLIARRIRQACYLLSTDTLPIEHVGARVGIANFSYFCRLFKKVTGFTPKQFRDHALVPPIYS
ncbi:AraC family transcriptional regulator [Paenibacillus thalictri]|uniref:AraC family transcriptional regulator n=1 Tax=Paenibacillus thalictri TaxID=2527873 RepID=A0A4V2J3E8_9BACL|nr:AraC family transcriptional regulator [Paenibacillus thalictri]TBL71532.1 AraC family transcriptional regulator [Paenibacillus thalictri]